MPHAVNAEARDLKAAGADVIQLDEPWLQARPEEAARRYGVAGAQPRAGRHRGPDGRASAASAMPTSSQRQAERLRVPAGTRREHRADQISIEAAQPKLDLGVLDGLSRQDGDARRDRHGDPRMPRRPKIVAGRIRAGLRHSPPERLIPAPDCGMKYLPREVAFAKLKALAEGAAMVRRELTGG